MASTDISSEVWSSENEADQAELILKRIVYGIELKIYYAMVTIMISFILLSLLIMLLGGMYKNFFLNHFAICIPIEYRAELF